MRVFAPGRINLVGEHTDYSGGLVLPAAIQLGVTLDVRGTSDRLELEAPSSYADGVWAELAELGRPPVGIVAEVASTLPMGVGLASSAAFEVAVALALCAAADFELPPLELAHACRRAEMRAVGVPCGILDQAACVLGEDGRAILLNCATLEHRAIPVPHAAIFVVIDSGTTRELADSGYAQRQAELAAGMERRVRHVESENARVLEMAEALGRGDLALAGHVMNASHASLRDDYEVSTPEVDRIVEEALAAGAYGARLVGGGFGGSVLALTDAEHPLDGLVVRPSRGAFSSASGW
ncbi:MAG TPA: galactokinase family protein [Gaiellaceae bacterium]|nr:galactokinase family protein [Gaiellaceae bacterium]